MGGDEGQGDGEWEGGGVGHYQKLTTPGFVLFYIIITCTHINQVVICRF